MNDLPGLERAREIASKTIAGELDPLLACRELVALRTGLLGVPERVIDTFVAVSSEVDDLPLGNERQRWALDALKAKDAEAMVYRTRVRDLVLEAMRELLAALNRER